MKTFAVFQTILAYFASPVLQFLWGLINSLQVIVLFVLLDVQRFPYNAQQVLIAIAKIVAFELIDTEELYADIFGFGETESVNDVFEEAEYDGSNYIQRLGMPFLLIMGFLFYLLNYFIMKKIVKKCDIKNKRVLTFVEDKNFKLIVIRFLLEGCIDISMSVSIALIFVSTSFHLQCSLNLEQHELRRLLGNSIATSLLYDSHLTTVLAHLPLEGSLEVASYY